MAKITVTSRTANPTAQVIVTGDDAEQAKLSAGPVLGLPKGVKISSIKLAPGKAEAGRAPWGVTVEATGIESAGLSIRVPIRIKSGRFERLQHVVLDLAADAKAKAKAKDAKPTADKPAKD